MRLIQATPAAYALQEIEATLNRIQDEVEKIQYFIYFKTTGIDSCSCCGLAVCCCALMTCVMWLPCLAGGVILNILTCGWLEAHQQEKINAIKPDQNEMYAINQLKTNLRLIPNQRNKLFNAQDSAISTINLIESTLNDTAVNKLRPFLETLKANIALRTPTGESSPVCSA